MKKLMLVTILVGFLAVPALATPTLGWWELEHPRATHQSWTFAPGEVFADEDPFAYYAMPTEKKNEGTAMAHIGIGALYDSDEEWFTGSEVINVMLEIDNLEDPLAYKDIYVKVDYVGDLTKMSALGFDGGTPYTVISIDPSLIGSNADFGFRIMPNPDKEHIYFSIEATCGDAVLSGITVDTICIPAPGAVLLGSIGVGLVGWLRRRRSL